MRRLLCWFVLSAVLLTPVAVAGQDRSSDWARVRRVQGYTVTVTTRSAPGSLRGLVALVDQSRLVLVTPADAVSSRDWTNALHEAESRWDLVAAGAERVTGRGHREISRDGLFQDGRQVASWTSVARDDIAAVTGTLRKRGSWRGLIIGGAAGTGAGVLLAFTGGYLNNEGGGGDVVIGLAGLVPVVSTLVGYFGFSRDEPFLYRQATPLSLPLDDATWRRISRALPPSLRGVESPRR